MSDRRLSGSEDADTALALASDALSDGDWPAAEVAYMRARTLYDQLGLADKVAECERHLMQLERSPGYSRDGKVAPTETPTAFELWAW